VPATALTAFHRALALAGEVVAAPWGTLARRIPAAVVSEAQALHRSGPRHVVGAMTAVAGVAAQQLAAAVRPRTTRRDTTVQLKASTTVMGSTEEVYAFWRDFQRLPEFMAHLDSVEATSDTKSRWTATAPFGRTVTWEAEVVDDRPGQLISWHSVPGSDISNEGSVRFAAAPGDRGTEVRVEIAYDIPGGPLGQALARFFGEDPRQQVDDDLRRFKQIFETGEIARSDGAPGGKRAREEFPQRPAQPMTDDEYAEFVTTGDAR